LDKLAQPQMSGLIIEPTMPKHPGADNGRCKGKAAKMPERQVESAKLG
jgi:hypothetical protein